MDVRARAEPKLMGFSRGIERDGDMFAGYVVAVDN
jgi:hypothetical protein